MLARGDERLWGESDAVSLTPRPYQTTALHALQTSPLRRHLVHHATGLGKTPLAAWWLQARPPYTRGLFLAHRDELIRQAVQKLDAVGVGRVGIVQAGTDDWYGTDVVVASVQTVQNLHRLRPCLTNLSRIVVDESHHVSADSYQRILAAAGVWAIDGPEVLGLTATPYRMDGRTLDDTFEHVAHQMTMLDGIREGYLCSLRGLYIHTKADFTGLRSSHGEIVAADAEGALMQAAVPEDIAKAVGEHAKGRPTVVFTPGVASAHAVADECRAVGLRFAAVDGAMDHDDRRAILADFAAGKLDGLANCAVLTEGYDEARIACIVMARPTQSKGFFVQCIGRGTRLHPEKEDCLVLDVCGVTHRHDLIRLADVIGLTAEKAREVLSTGGTLQEALIEEGRLGPKTSPVDLFKERPFAWVKSRLGYVLALGRDGWIVLHAIADGWEVRREAGRDRQVLGRYDQLGYAQGAAEDAARRMGSTALVKKSARWRREPMSDGQKGMCIKWNVRFERGMTKGAAADALTAAMADARARGR